MRILNQTSDPNEYVIFFFKDRVGKPIYMHLLLKIKVFPENMGIELDKKTKIIWGIHTDPPTWGPPVNWKICQL